MNCGFQKWLRLASFQMLTAAICGTRSRSEETKLQYAAREEALRGAESGLPNTLRMIFWEPALATAALIDATSESLG